MNATKGYGTGQSIITKGYGGAEQQDAVEVVNKIVTRGYGNNQLIIIRGFGTLPTPTPTPTPTGGYYKHIIKKRKLKYELSIYGQIIIRQSLSVKLFGEILRGEKHSQELYGNVFKSHQSNLILTGQILKNHYIEYGLHGKLLNTNLRKSLQFDETFLFQAFQLIKERHHEKINQKSHQPNN